MFFDKSMVLSNVLVLSLCKSNNMNADRLFFALSAPTYLPLIESVSNCWALQDANSIAGIIYAIMFFIFLMILMLAFHIIVSCWQILHKGSTNILGMQVFLG